MYCQDVSSFGNTPVKMCHLSAGGLEAHLNIICGLVGFLHFVVGRGFGSKMCHLSAGGLEAHLHCLDWVLDFCALYSCAVSMYMYA